MSVPALCVFIVVGRSPMQDRVIVQELHVARLEIHFQAKFFRKLVKEFECFFLLFGQAWGLGEGLCCAKVAGRIDAGQAATEIVENRGHVPGQFSYGNLTYTRYRKGLVKRAKKVRSGVSNGVVYGARAGDAAQAAFRRRMPAEQSDDVA